MPIMPQTAPPTDTYPLRVHPLCIGRPRALAAIAALVASAFVAGCNAPPKPAAEPAPPAPTAAPATADKSTTTIQCPTRGAFSNGPAYYSQFYEDYILGYVFKDQKSGFYVDVGASHPTDGSVTRLLYDRGWSGINVEPGPNFETSRSENPLTFS